MKGGVRGGQGRARVEEEAAGSTTVAASCVTSAPSIKTESEYGEAEGE